MLEQRTDINMVHRWVNHYKNLLGLQHWNITVRLVSSEEQWIEAEDEIYQGRISVHDSLLSAHIDLLDPMQTSTRVKNKLGVELDLRSTLLHEMIHILLEPCDIPDENEVQYEQAVIRLERAIRHLEDRKDGKIDFS